MSEYWRKQIEQRAAEDSEFRRQLKSDPRAALQSELGVSIPDSIRINVVEY